MEKKKEIVITEECEISIPKAGMVIQFDGKIVQVGFVTNTHVVVDGDLKIASTGTIEMVSQGDAVLSTVNGKVHLGNTEKVYKAIEDKKDGC